METELNLKLQEMCKKLGGAESLNYSCSAKIYTGNWSEGKELKDLLKEIMGADFSIMNLQESSLSVMLEVFRESFLYLGDSGSHPNAAYFGSVLFKSEFECILEGFGKLFNGSSNVYSFHILEGNPFYPVFWEFAFLINLNRKAYIIIGSSSD